MRCVKALYQLRPLDGHLVNEAVCARTSQDRHKVNEGHGAERKMWLQLMSEQHQMMSDVHTVVVMNS